MLYRTILLVIKVGKRKPRFVFTKIKNWNENGFILWIVKIGYLPFIQSCVKCGKFTSTYYNHNDWRSNASLLRTPTNARKSPRKRNIWLDELVLFQAADKIVDTDSISDSPENFTFKRLDNSVQLFSLKERLVLLQFTNVLVQIEISMFVYIILWFSYTTSAMVSIWKLHLLNLVYLKTLSLI